MAAFVVSAEDSDGDPIEYSVWQAGDVNHDGLLTSLDILRLIATLNSTDDTIQPGHHYWNPEMDVSNDNLISPLDILVLISLLNDEDREIPGGEIDGDTGYFSWQPNYHYVRNTNLLTFVASDGTARDAETVRVTVTYRSSVAPAVSDAELLDETEARSAHYFYREALEDVATKGFGLAALCAIAERYGTTPRWFIPSALAKRRANEILDACLPIPDGTSALDKAILMAGAVTAGEYFGGEVKAKAETLCNNVDWDSFLETILSASFLPHNFLDCKGIGGGALEKWNNTAAAARALADADFIIDGRTYPYTIINSFHFLPTAFAVFRDIYNTHYKWLWFQYGPRDSFDSDGRAYAKYVGINVGSQVLMIENYRSGLIWDNFIKNAKVKAAVDKLYRNRSVYLIPDSWNLKNMNAGEPKINKKIIVTNDGNVPVTYSLSVKDVAGAFGGWQAAAAPDVNKYATSAIFTDVNVQSVDESDFGPEDLLSETPKKPIENGVNVPPGESRALWLKFNAPSADTTNRKKHEEHFIYVEVKTE